MINKAIEFATRAHAGQFRKGTRRPYIVHPIEVGDIVSTMTQDEEIISAAVLHDTIVKVYREKSLHGNFRNEWQEL